MSLSDEQWFFLQDVSSLIQKAKELGFKVTGGELYRPPEMQKIYVDSGRSMTMNSKHLRRCAVDFNFFRKVDGKWKLTWSRSDIEELGDFWESLNKKNRWGGNFNSFKDLPHFQRTV